jgi:D-alanyl-D-alanine carboxypeptidase
MSERPRAGFGAIARTAVAAALALTLACALAGPSEAHVRHARASRIAAWNALSATDPLKDAALIIDGETGKVLYARNADAERHPASLTKMMTLYLLFERLRSGAMTLSTPIPISEHASVQAPTKLYLRPGSEIPVDTAIRAVVVKSANDVAVAIAEAVGGTESHFAEMMNDKARAFGMSHTFYHNASGLPDQLQITSARDLAVLARHLAYDFPQYFHYFSTTSFTFRGQLYPGHDNLLGHYDGADGMKTGYTNGSGFNLVSSVVRGNVHIIGVVMGGRSAHKRDMEMVRLLDDTFAQIDQNPTLVARATLPWQALADNSRNPAVVASLALPTIHESPAAPSGTLRITPNGEIDEDTAESRTDPDDDHSLPVSNLPEATPRQALPPMETAPRAVNVVAPRQAPAATALRTFNVITPTPRQSPPPVATGLRMVNVIAPTARPEPATGKALVLASYEPPQLRNVIVPTARDAGTAHDEQRALTTVNVIVPTARDAGRAHDVERAPTTMQAAVTKSGGAIVPSSVAAANQWTIQIGAFADVASAKAQLAAYAEHSMDVLGQAQRIVVPFEGVDGHTLYRARFGPFVEKEAREVCQRLTQRGQTCFAAMYR